MITDSKVFGWARRDEPTPSEVFVGSLPPGPLRAHLAQLHSLFYFEQQTGSTSAEDSDTRLQLFEHSLRNIARFSMTPPHVQSQREGERIRKGARKQFKQSNQKEKS